MLNKLFRDCQLILNAKMVSGLFSGTLINIHMKVVSYYHFLFYIFGEYDNTAIAPRRTRCGND